MAPTANTDDSPDEIERMLVSEFWKAVGASPTSHTHVKGHLWRYALPSKSLLVRCVFDQESQIDAYVDWCGGTRVEGAFLSGMAIAGKMMGHTNTLAKESQHQ